MKNLLFYGTTDYGLNLNNSDELKFKELSKNFNAFVITYGSTNIEKKHRDVLIKYLKKPTNLLLLAASFSKGVIQGSSDASSKTVSK